MDEKLPWHQRLGMQLHLLYCVWCRRYAVQLRFLRVATRRLLNGLDDAPPQSLSLEAKEQIQACLRRAMKQSPPAGE